MLAELLEITKVELSAVPLTDSEVGRLKDPEDTEALTERKVVAEDEGAAEETEGTDDETLAGVLEGTKGTDVLAETADVADDDTDNTLEEEELGAALAKVEDIGKESVNTGTLLPAEEAELEGNEAGTELVTIGASEVEGMLDEVGEKASTDDTTDEGVKLGNDKRDDDTTDDDTDGNEVALWATLLNVAEGEASGEEETADEISLDRAANDEEGAEGAELPGEDGIDESKSGAELVEKATLCKNVDDGAEELDRNVIKLGCNGENTEGNVEGKSVTEVCNSEFPGDSSAGVLLVELLDSS
ncbi:hypothetical protein PHLCEN_2v4639 [Hermanssonia centrifuga]|uniref:Uncharacterized protein n=1 Tax=Hermanssonia centrifuga TaxID=98765 RepID=A0A2R6PNN3_9APHY|nr:hypothetical protein PHLCEN_2v4639 [Hermanssonia centrifuga]